jgi:hypothetical protein
VSGPCPGKHLIRIELSESQGQIHWQPTDRFQPVF